jgi:hypothetical protein
MHIHPFLFENQIKVPKTLRENPILVTGELLFVTGIAPVTFQALQIAQHR